MLDDLRKQAARRWSDATGQLSTGRKIALVTLALVLLACLITAGLYAARPDYQVVFANLEPDAAAGVVERLKELKVPFKLQDGGRTVLVPGEDADELRVVLGPTVGNPQGEPAEEISWLETTPTQVEARQRRRLESALTRTINRLDAVASSQVHLNVPSPSVFVDRQLPPSASVTLTADRRRSLGREDGYVVASIVAGAVAGLEAERVTVVDTRGRRIWPEGSGLGGLREQEQALEAEMQSRLTQELEKVVGPGRASVMVDVELDATKSETVVDKVDAEVVPTRERQSEEQRQGGGSGPAGVAGAANVDGGNPGMVAVGAAAGGTAMTRKQVSTDYAHGSEKRTVVKDAGNIQWVSISARVSGTMAAVGGAGAPAGAKPAYQPLSAEKMGEIKKLLAVYVRPERGDRLEVVDLPLAPVEEGAEAGGAEPRAFSWLLRALPYIVPLLLGLLVVLFVLRPLVGMLTRRPIVPEVLPAEEATQAGLTDGGRVNPAELPAASVVNFLREYAQQDPERTALALGRWLKKAT